MDSGLSQIAMEDGVSLNQGIAVANGQKIGVVETGSDFLKHRSAKARPTEMLTELDKAERQAPSQGDEV